jgi:hypothetical protein
MTLINMAELPTGPLSTVSNKDGDPAGILEAGTGAAAAAANLRVCTLFVRRNGEVAITATRLGTFDQIAPTFEDLAVARGAEAGKVPDEEDEAEQPAAVAEDDQGWGSETFGPLFWLRCMTIPNVQLRSSSCQAKTSNGVLSKKSFNLQQQQRSSSSRETMPAGHKDPAARCYTFIFTLSSRSSSSSYCIFSKTFAGNAGSNER